MLGPGARRRAARPVVDPLEPTAFAEAAALLARAFRDNPLNVAVIGAGASARRRERCNAVVMRNLLRVAAGSGVLLGVRYAGVLAGGLVAAPPYGFPFPAPGVGAQLRALLVQGLRVAARWREAFERLQRRRPIEAHAYLGLLGVEPSLQRRGVGAAALEAWLARVDADGLPAYLETDREENLRFYGRVGFGIVGEIEVLGARVWCMRRPPAMAVSVAAALR
ncbi:MAG: GNAT family N-acetyltransferase [Deltaproteobacteria bacterium]|nr:GNAT family N-acetyltransferase [Deltaproteobacteria bacterium]